MVDAGTVGRSFGGTWTKPRCGGIMMCDTPSVCTCEAEPAINGRSGADTPEWHSPNCPETNTGDYGVGSNVGPICLWELLQRYKVLERAFDVGQILAVHTHPCLDQLAALRVVLDLVDAI